MEIKEIRKEIYLMEDHISVVFIKTGEEKGILIDTGIDKSYGKKVGVELKKLKIRDLTIINSHSHGDHYGGNTYFQKEFSCIFYATEIEKAIIENPILEPIYLGSGAWPIKELRTKFLMGESVKVNKIIDPLMDKLIIDGISLEIIELPGHGFSQIGIGIQDVMYLADILYSKETLEKHKIPYLTDVKSCLMTLKKLKKTSYTFYIGAHLGIVHREELEKLVMYHENRINEIINFIYEITLEHKEIEFYKVMNFIMKKYNIKISGIGQYYLMNGTITSFVNYLHEKGEIEIFIKENKLGVKICNKKD